MPCKFLFTYLNITNLKDSQCNVTYSATVIANLQDGQKLLRKCDYHLMYRILRCQ